MDPNPNVSRTVGDPFVDVETKWTLSMFRSWVTHYMARLALTEFHFRTPETRNLKTRDSARDDLLEIGPERPRLRRDGRLGCRRRNGPRGCESGGLGLRVGPGFRARRENPGCREARAADFQNFRKRTLIISERESPKCPTRPLVNGIRAFPFEDFADFLNQAYDNILARN
jgi:hypothetical protein